MYISKKEYNAALSGYGFIDEAVKITISLTKMMVNPKEGDTLTVSSKDGKQEFFIMRIK